MIDDKFIACTGKRELEEFCGILSAAKFEFRVEEVATVLGICR